MQHRKFAVNSSPFCAWGWDLQKLNLECINSIDPGYFEYLASIPSEALKTDDHKQHAALSLRAAYSHGLETFFAVLFAAIQAPDCVFGWLHKYKDQHIIKLIKSINIMQPIFSKIEMNPTSWETISNLIHGALIFEDKQHETQLKQHFATTWRNFADDFINEAAREEYNSIKHGFRVAAGGFKMWVGKQDSPNVPVPPERMRSLGGSEYGSTFFVTKMVGENRSHFSIKQLSRNWNPESFLFALNLISMSLGNILSFLKIVNGVDPTKVSFSGPIEETDFLKPWKLRPSLTGTSMEFSVAPPQTNLFSKEDILAIYKTKNE